MHGPSTEQADPPVIEWMAETSRPLTCPFFSLWLLAVVFSLKIQPFLSPPMMLWQCLLFVIILPKLLRRPVPRPPPGEGSQHLQPQTHVKKLPLNWGSMKRAMSMTFFALSASHMLRSSLITRFIFLVRAHSSPFSTATSSLLMWLRTRLITDGVTRVCC